jgi:hypothetical protein
VLASIRPGPRRRPPPPFPRRIYVFGFGGKFLDDQQTTCLLDSPQAIAGMQQAFDFVVKDMAAQAAQQVTALLRKA